ncbi:MAG: hypothetical protein ACFCU3_01040 [Verrucomicrobiales bacterium]
MSENTLLSGTVERKLIARLTIVACVATVLAPVVIIIEIQTSPLENIPPTGLVPVGK